MTPDRWQKLQTLFHRALRLNPSERRSFFDMSCGEDELLREELESLLASNELPVSLFDGVSSTSINPSELSAGQTIEHYRLISLIGKGGMGEVYLAEDLTLG